MSGDKLKLQLSQHFCHATKIFCPTTSVLPCMGVMLCPDCYPSRCHNKRIFSLTASTVLQNATSLWLLSSYVLENTMKQPDQYYIEDMKTTLQALTKFTKNTPRLWLMRLASITKILPFIMLKPFESAKRPFLLLS